MSEIIKQTTVKIAANYYDTVVFDESDDRRHAGATLSGHEWEGTAYGPWIIDKLNIRSETRSAAMDQHREAVYAARTEELV